ncbi:DUF7146 domain-containing protein [Pseudovibrio ascidiaceicola]|uniref:DUF7146 domain-containing protein n=1 Tax=Pseudovibrio ascidiaceicola TaxID=285279 RepID=UPI000D689032|nr:CHC2 zinc finger domain-containing protein [Pseudovibrio ascidiaceicola]
MRFSEFQVDKIKQSANLYERICQHTTLRRAGRQYSGKCPFPDHDDRNASFVFDPIKNTFRCYSTECDRAGSIIDWMMEFEGFRSFLDCIRDLNGEELVQNIGQDNERKGPVYKRQKMEDRIAADQEKARAAGYRIFKAGHALSGSVAETYLRETRGLGDIGLPEAVLRFASDLPFWAEVRKGKFEVVHRGPALLAAFQYRDNRFAAVHQTWLKPDGSGKAEIVLDDGQQLPAKKIRGPFMGSSLRLGPPAPIMGLGEGIETCLSGMAHGLSCWAAGSLGNLVGRGWVHGIREPHPKRIGQRLPTTQPDFTSVRMDLPYRLRSAIILADSDSKDLDGLKAELERAVRRARCEGRSARILWPPLGMDMNDWIMKERRDAA